MSRHKLIKNLDLDNELDDFDGGDFDYEDEDAGEVEELSEYDQEQMRVGLAKVREILPAGSSSITDRQVQDALWHYFYDVEQSIAYLLKMYLPKAPKPAKKAAGRVSEPSSAACSKPFSFADFFNDSPWLNIPSMREAVLIPPLFHQGGLLGGSSDGAPKMSKLQALAAARKKKALEMRKDSGSDMEISVSTSTPDGIETSTSTTKEPTTAGKPRNLPFRNRKESNTSTEPSPVEEKSRSQSPHQVDNSQTDQAKPSAFASTIIGNTFSNSPLINSLFTIPYAPTGSSTNPFAGPSPDDIVIAAQSKAPGKGGKDPPKTKAEKKSDQRANNVEAMRIDDTPKVMSKNLDVLAEFEKSKAKNAANFVVIGHVDAGKSTLMGRLLFDLKVVDQRTIDRYRKEAENEGKSSFALAWVLDQGTQERERGVTIDIATNKFETEKTAFTILDAPGHRDFIPNMIAGTSQADLAVLVIDASTGSFESGLKGQTREHALLARSMGVQRMIVAVNKLDTVNWSKDRFDEISQQISAFLTTAGFQAKNISFVPCSGLLGDNITRKSTEAFASWYTGGTLVEELDNSEPIARAMDKPLRLTIGDIFHGGVQNPLSISGRIEAGSLQVRDALLAQPSNQKSFIKSLEVDNERVDWAVAGQNVTLHLSDIDPVHLKVGHVLCPPTNPIKNIKVFTAKVLAFEFLMPMQADVHRGRVHVAGKLKEIVAVLDKSTGAPIGKKKPKIVKPGQIARVVVELSGAVPLEAPGRVVLRSDGQTMAAGLLE